MTVGGSLKCSSCVCSISALVSIILYHLTTLLYGLIILPCSVLYVAIISDLGFLFSGSGNLKKFLKKWRILMKVLTPQSNNGPHKAGMPLSFYLSNPFGEGDLVGLADVNC